MRPARVEGKHERAFCATDGPRDARVELAVTHRFGGSQPPGRLRLWFAFGFPAFAAVAAIFWLMIARPQFELV